MTFIDFMRRRGIPVKMGISEGEVFVCCLFCAEQGETPDTRFRLGVNYVTGVGHCFNCDWRSRRAVEDIVRRLGGSGVDTASIPATVADLKPPQVALPLDFQYLCRPDRKDARTSDAVRYLISRGVTGDQIKRHRVGISLLGRYAYRAIFPVYRRGQLEGFVARDYTGCQDIRYLMPPGPKPLFGLAEETMGRLAVLSEGVFKALRIELALPRCCSVAVLGHDLTPHQTEWLQQIVGVDGIIIWPDPDLAGVRGAVGIADTLVGLGMEVKLIYPPSKVPADELPIPQIREILKTRVKPYCWQVRATALVGLGGGG
jgi:hypothetical protein